MSCMILIRWVKKKKARIPGRGEKTETVEGFGYGKEPAAQRRPNPPTEEDTGDPTAQEAPSARQARRAALTHTTHNQKFAQQEEEVSNFVQDSHSARERRGAGVNAGSGARGGGRGEKMAFPLT